VSYNASTVKIYNATCSLVRFKDENIFLYIHWKKTLAYLLCTALSSRVHSCKYRSRRIRSRGQFLTFLLGAKFVSQRWSWPPGVPRRGEDPLFALGSSTEKSVFTPGVERRDEHPLGVKGHPWGQTRVVKNWPLFPLQSLPRFVPYDFFFVFTKSFGSRALGLDFYGAKNEKKVGLPDGKIPNLGRFGGSCNERC
jgi:hypothetical protein